jgi:glycosyltransferase involved in cell wall biosynthesis
MHVLPNAVDVARFPAKTRPLDAAARRFRDELGLVDEDFLAVAVGMINPRKGLVELVETFADVQNNLTRQSRRLAHLAIVGAPIFNDDHLYEARVQARVRELGLESTVRMTGPRADVPAVLRAADLLVHNASVEPFGLVVLEAMASGTPVIATDVGGIPEIVEDGVNGSLIPTPERRFYRDDEARGETILGAIVDPSSYARMSVYALRETVPRFGMDRFAPGVAHLYEEVLGVGSRKNRQRLDS